MEVLHGRCWLRLRTKENGERGTASERESGELESFSTDVVERGGTERESLCVCVCVCVCVFEV